MSVNSKLVKQTLQYQLQNLTRITEEYALIELITNCDDAYREKKGKEDGGSILIREDVLIKKKGASKKLLSVSDAAGGLDYEGLEKSFTEYAGDEVSTRNTRGFFGRGSKDIATLGPTVYASIKNNKYSAIRLFLGKEGVSYEWTAEEKDADDAHYSLLDLKNNEEGLKAEIVIKRNFHFTRLIEKIETHFALRDIIQRRHVFIRDAKGKEEELVSLNEKRKAYEQVLEDYIIKVQGYEDVVLNLWKLPNESSLGTVDAYSENGILLRGRFGIYGNSLFDLNLPKFGFHGELFMPEIEKINKAVMQERVKDQNFDNEFPINPDRSGINTRNPYIRTVKDAVVAFLKDYIQTNSEPSSIHDFEELQNKHRSKLNQLLKQIESSLDLDDSYPQEESEVDIIPPRKYSDLDVRATFTLKILQRVDPKDIEIRIRPTSGAFKITSGTIGSDLDWRNSDDGRYRTASIHVVGEDEGEASLEALHHSNLVSTATFLCPKPPYEYPEIKELTFKTPKATVGKNKTRRLQLWGPLDLLGRSVNCIFHNELVTGPASIVLTLSRDKKYAVGFLEMRAGDTAGETNIESTVGFGENKQRAGCVLIIQDTADDKNVIPDFRLQTGESTYRSYYDRSAHKIMIYPNHPSCGSAFKPYLDRRSSSDGSDTKKEDLTGCYETLSEIYVYEIAAWIAKRYFDQNIDTPNFTFDKYYEKFNEILSKFLIGFREAYKKELRADLNKHIKEDQQ